MFLTTQEGVLNKKYRKQLLAALSVTLITFAHGVILGWLSPMLLKLQSEEQSPTSFSLTLEEASWVGSLIFTGGTIGNLIFGYLLDRFGRKVCLHGIAVPHFCFWTLVYFARSVEYLYVARLVAGITGGGCYVVLPIFIGELSDSKIRGRLTSLFSLTMNSGIMIGFVLSSHLPYHLIPSVVVVLPILYLLLTFYFPETPQYLLRSGDEINAQKSFMFYKNCPPTMSKAELQQFETEFCELKAAVAKQQSSNQGNVRLQDFLEKPSLRALCSGLVLMVVNVFAGGFALIFYMSSIFAAVKVELHPDTNTIIIGAVQIVGNYTAIILIDRFGRKVLMMVSTAGMGIGLALFGMYGFFAEETDYDLSDFSYWLPLLLMSFAIFSANIGLISVTFLLLVEIMPAKIRSRAASSCLAFGTIFGFISVKTFPICMDLFGVSATIWLCASVCAFGLFFVTIFIKETNGKSLNKDDNS